VTLQHNLIPLPESFFLNCSNGVDNGIDYHELLVIIQQIDPSWSLFFDIDSVSIVNFENTPIKTLGDYHWSESQCSNLSQCDECESECFHSNLETKRAELVFCFPRISNETDLLYDWEYNLAELGIKRIYK